MPIEKTGIIEELKKRKTAVGDSWERLKENPGVSEKIGNTVIFGGKTLRFATGILTAPVVLALNVVSKAMPVLWETAIQVVRIPHALISKIIKPDSPYNGKVIDDIGFKVGQFTEAVFDETSKIVHKAF